jgi:hypothetical protein
LPSLTSGATFGVGVAAGATPGVVVVQFKGSAFDGVGSFEATAELKVTIKSS